MASSLDRLASNLCYTGGIQCSKCNGDMELVNISSKYIALLECKKCKTKKNKDLDEGVLKRTLTTPAGVGCDENFFLMIWKGVYPCMSIWIAGRFLRRQCF